MDANRHWFKSRLGIEFQEAPRRVSMCSYCFLSESSPIFVIEDTHSEPKYACNPLVTGFPYIRFYAGASLFIEGVKVGVLCVIDRKPRYDFGIKQQKILTELAECVTDLVLMRRKEMLEQRYHCVPLHQSVLTIIKEPLTRVLESREWIADILNQLRAAQSSVQLVDLLVKLKSIATEFAGDLKYLETMLGASTHVLTRLLQTDMPSVSVSTSKAVGQNGSFVRTDEWWAAFLQVFSFANLPRIRPVCHLTAEGLYTHPELLLLTSGALIGHLMSSHAIVGVVVWFCSSHECHDGISSPPAVADAPAQGMVVVDIEYTESDISDQCTVSPRFGIHGMVASIRQILQWAQGRLQQDSALSRFRLLVPCRLVHKRTASFAPDEIHERARKARRLSTASE